MKGHPGGEAHTRELLAQAALPEGARVLDMGAGDGSAVHLLQSCGYQAVGLDLEPRGSEVQQGDFLHSGFADGTFDGVLSQCAFYVSGDREGALRESARVLKKGGRLLFSDVWFAKEPEIGELLARAGFRLLYLEDQTASWKEYYIEGIWKGTIAPECIPKSRCRYYMAVAEKE